MFKKIQQTITHPLFSILWVSLIALSYKLLDKPIAYFFQQHHSTVFVTIADYVNELGLSGYYISGFLLLYLMTRFIIKRPSLSNNALFLLQTVLLSGIFCLVLKILLSRARPIQLFDQQLFGFFFFKTKAAFWSFPSGHSTTISAVMIALCLLLPRYWSFFIAGLVLVSFSRVIVTAHYLSDILAGIYLGGFTVFWLYYYSNAKLLAQNR